MSYAELARWLTEQGCPTTKEDVENARRPNVKLVEQIVPYTQDIQRFVHVIVARFPQFDSARLRCNEPYPKLEPSDEL